MLFNSVEFFLFFLIVFPVFLVARGRARNLFLVGASYWFYAHWNVHYLALVIVVTVLDFCAGQLIGRFPKQRRLVLLVSIASNLGILGFFKYANFLLESAAGLAALAAGATPAISHLDVILPIGISFYTFESLSYVIDVYRGRLEPHRSLFEYALFISFFPHLVAGPIVRPAQFLTQAHHGVHPDAERIHSGFVLFLTGLFKKAVLADNLARIVDPVFADPGSFAGLDNLVAVYAFAFQIYFDFSGYTDMAIGLARMMGFWLPANFDHPYGARSFREFWRRWHISLSTWLRDYLYVSLGGNRKGRPRELANVMITMALGGLWHGASATFLVWGTLHGVYLVIERLGGGGAPAGAGRGSRSWLQSFAIFHLVAFGWIFFRSPDFATAALVLSRIAFAAGEPYVYAWALVPCGLLWAWEVLASRGDPWGGALEGARGTSFAYVAAMIAAVLLFGRVDAESFIYFQF